MTADDDGRGPRIPDAREFQIDIRRCIVRTCGGELAEMSYYERNNWLTVEYKCAKCGREFTVKVEC